MILSKDSILSAQDFTTQDIDVPEWGGSVRVRGLSSREKDQIEERIAKTQDMSNIRASVCAMAIVDEDGKRMFSDKDAATLGEKNAVVMARIFDSIRELSGMGDDVLEEAQGN